ncbi:hypothetical protein PHSC3_000398 [Chlamydiales bacterium STE3]|nr:hypothetical protein PHSC3_000398 [Chlamydiales bacterium STE3]
MSKNKSYIKETMFKKNRSYQGPCSDHFDGKKFFYPGSNQPSFRHFIKWISTRSPAKWPKQYPVTPTVPPQAHQELLVTLINHSSVLIQWEEMNILTDPIWSDRASPFAWIGPKRVHKPGVAFEDLPPIHLVLLSHNHYDHLDLPTLKRLNEQHHPLILTGLGNSKLLKKHHLTLVEELDWWQNHKVGPLSISFTPAKHFSARWLWDRNDTLFGSFVISLQGKSLFFAGDSGYGPHFQEIGERFPFIKLALLPIGAFEPRWFMKFNHLSPLDALQAHQDLHAETSIAIHHSTFPLSDEAIDKPQTIIDTHKKENRFLILPPGGSQLVY